MEELGGQEDKFRLCFGTIKPLMDSNENKFSSI